jgi:hypothetical protein
MRLSHLTPVTSAASLRFVKAFHATRLTVACGLLIFWLSDSALRAESALPTPHTEVTFIGADSYSDSKLSESANWYRDSVFKAVRSFLVKQTDQLLPEGYHLKIIFTDIDLGHRNSRRELAFGAPAFEFSYLVTDSSGRVVRQGYENLKEYTDFGNYRFSVETTDLTTEIIQPQKAMLKSWAVTKLADLKQH